MQWLGVPFEVFPSDFAEENVHFTDFDDPADYVATIATGKALVVAQRYPDALIIASLNVLFYQKILTMPEKYFHPCAIVHIPSIQPL